MERVLDTREYVSALREIVEQGGEVSMVIWGSSMAPFLVHGRDIIFFSSPDRPLRRGDMVFYQRENGQFVMHRIYRVTKEGYDMVGDGQTQIEQGIRREQIFARITCVKRKGRMLTDKNFWWRFFASVWLTLLPLRPRLVQLYGLCKRT